MARALSRSKVELFLQCPRCFWLDAVAGVRQPPGFPFNLNSAVDHLLKNEFDRYRGGAEVPRAWRARACRTSPRRTRNCTSGGTTSPACASSTRRRASPSSGRSTTCGSITMGRTTWSTTRPRRRRTRSVSTPTGRAATGARSSSTSGCCGNGLAVSDRAWFVYANGIRDAAGFGDVLRFRTRLIAYDGKAAWVEPALREIGECLARGRRGLCLAGGAGSPLQTLLRLT